MIELESVGTLIDEKTGYTYPMLLDGGYSKSEAVSLLEIENLEWFTNLSWDDIQVVMNVSIKLGIYDELVESLGKPIHVLKHDKAVEAMNKKG
jgi:hypothetical protein|tara:strand:+ start:699 stop:977 length:279 start_codon:yes stop_codon:yes gene_type:complete